MLFVPIGLAKLPSSDQIIKKSEYKREKKIRGREEEEKMKRGKREEGKDISGSSEVKSLMEKNK